MTRWVDDYIGVTHKDKAQEGYLKAQIACRKLGVPVHKLEAPSHSLSYCGVVFDTHSMSMSIPNTKRKELLLLLDMWQKRTSCKKTALQSLVGKLNHIAMVIRPGRAFIGRMLRCLREHHHLRSFRHISLPASATRYQMVAFSSANMEWYNNDYRSTMDETAHKRVVR